MGPTVCGDMDIPGFSQVWARSARFGALLAALVLSASACGAGSDTAGVSDATAATVPDVTESAGGESAEDADGSQTDAGSDADAGSDGAAAPQNLFAPFDVVDLATDQTLNLAEELGGGDKAVLLWFWAPH